MSQDSKTTNPHDPDLLTAAMIDASNRLESIPGAGQAQALVMIAAAGFSIASAIRDLAAAVWERGK